MKDDQNDENAEQFIREEKENIFKKEVLYLIWLSSLCKWVCRVVGGAEECLVQRGGGVTASFITTHSEVSKATTTPTAAVLLRQTQEDV